MNNMSQRPTYIPGNRNYRPDIDGLRALAVLPVVFYHADFRNFPGGFVGVDVFFVISGYLITSIIYEDIAHQKFSFAHFYERRIRRIFPALFSMALFCLIASLLLLPPTSTAEFGKSLLAMAVFSSNIYFRLSSGPQGYFDIQPPSQPLLHTWSLAIEEQFYIFFPIALILLTRLSKKYVYTILIAGLLASFFLCMWSIDHKPLAAFYYLPMRAWELLIGAGISILPLPKIQRAWLNQVLALIGLSLIIYAVLTLNKLFLFPSYNALLPTLGAGLLIYVGRNQTTVIGKLLGLPPIRFLGAISYSLYLWHWPIIVFATYFFVGVLSIWQIAIILSTSILIAVISFKWIETPFRRSQHPLLKQNAILATGLLTALAFFACGLTLTMTHGLPQRYDARTLALIAENLQRSTDHQPDDGCTNYMTRISSLQDVKFCTIGASREKNILLIGDSHVDQLMPIFRQLDQQKTSDSDGMITAIAAGCAFSKSLNRLEVGYYCLDFSRYAMERALQPDISTVYIGFSAWWMHKDGLLCQMQNGTCVWGLNAHRIEQIFMTELESNINELRAHHKRVILSMPFPIYDRSIPDLEIHNLLFSKFGSNLMPIDQVPDFFRDDVAAIVARTGSFSFEPRTSLCVDGHCLYQIDGVSIYSDSNHLATSQIHLLDRDLIRIITDTHQL